MSVAHADLLQPADGVAARCRVLVVDAHELFHAAIREIIARRSGHVECFGATDGSVARQLMRKHRPNLAVVNVMVGSESGIDLARRLACEDPFIRILLTSDWHPISDHMLRTCGARAPLPKQASVAVVLDTIDRVLRDVTVPSPARRGPSQALTMREDEVLQLLSRGLSNVEIAGELRLSLNTVKQHASSLFRKLDSRNRVDAVTRAMAAGLIR